LCVREKAHTREGDINAAARRRLLMVRVGGCRDSAHWQMWLGRSLDDTCCSRAHQKGMTRQKSPTVQQSWIVPPNVGFEETVTSTSRKPTCGESNIQNIQFLVAPFIRSVKSSSAWSCFHRGRLCNRRLLRRKARSERDGLSAGAGSARFPCHLISRTEFL
jgi:hypothetical protein